LFLDQEANAGPYFRGQQQKRAKPHLQLLQHLSSLVTRQGICKTQSRSQKVAVQHSISGPKHRMKICYPPSLRSNKNPTDTDPHLALRTLFCACRQMTLAQKLAPTPYFQHAACVLLAFVSLYIGYESSKLPFKSALKRRIHQERIMIKALHRLIN
jgi:hypothetical protein